MRKIRKYIEDNTSNKINKKRKLSNKYSFDLKIISVVLASSNLFGFVILPNKVDKNIKHTRPIIIEHHDLGREYRDNLSTLPTDTNDDIIERWANVFELEPEIVKDIIHKETNNFTDEDALNEYYDGYTDDHNFTKAVIYFIREINKSPENYGYSRDEIESGIDFYTPMSVDEQIVVICEELSGANGMNGPCPFFAEAVKTTEWGHPNTGNPNSINFFGWSASGLKNETMGVLIPLIGLTKNYGITKDVTDDDIRAISYSYCENPEKWATAVIYQFDYFKENGILCDYSEEERKKMIIPNTTYDEYVENNYNIPRYKDRLNKRTI